MDKRSPPITSTHFLWNIINTLFLQTLGKSTHCLGKSYEPRKKSLRLRKRFPKKSAPSFEGIPLVAIKAPNLFTKILTAHLKGGGRFLTIWKQQKLVLIPEPSSGLRMLRSINLYDHYMASVTASDHLQYADGRKGGWSLR